jgi:hypothetical protein
MANNGRTFTMRDDTETCTCGDVLDEHGGDAKYPGSTKCNVEGCECVAFEAAGEEPDEKDDDEEDDDEEDDDDEDDEDDDAAEGIADPGP